MKTTILKITIAVMSLIAIEALAPPSVHLARLVERRTAAVSGPCRPGAEIPGHSYGEVVNGLFSAAGR
jgi:hypothetical protein